MGVLESAVTEAIRRREPRMMALLESERRSKREKIEAMLNAPDLFKAGDGGTRC